MSGEIPSFAKYVFLLAFLVSAIIGVWSYLSPESFCGLTEWPLEPATVRLVASFLIAFSIAAILAYRATTWKEIELYVQMIILWTIITSVGLIWSTVVVPLPLIGWLLTALVLVFFILYLYIYMKR
ncbi:MAG: hypothetical protein EAX95_09360 [Candidatus Thorarchaeota archaeon]|nr:hypothetical protein [Candidatus Thorarchaeota archaeon]